MLQGVFVRVHIKEEGGWGSERQGTVFIRAHTFYIRRGVCVFVFVCLKRHRHLYLRIYMCLGLTPNLSASLTQSTGGTPSHCATVSFTRDYCARLRVSVRPSVRPFTPPPPLYLPTTTRQPSQTSH